MNQNLKISVIGLGYVGLPVAIGFSKRYHVIGFDTSETRILELKVGKDSNCDTVSEDFQNTNIHFTSDPDDLYEATFHIIAVPTPIDEAKQPDLRLLLKATEVVGQILKPGDFVVYESTVYPGCIEEECAPVLERLSGLKYLNGKPGHVGVGCKITSTHEEKSSQDFYLGYSPERINPGDSKHTFTSIKKIVSGSTPETTDQIAEVYASVVTAGVYKTSSIKVAEAAKVIENAQRDLNIAFVNELAMIFNRINIDTQEVLDAAETKWNFLPFRPGLVGGHCISIDPYYLTHLAERSGYHPQVILSGRHINDNMGTYVAQQTVKTMVLEGIGIVGSKVTVLGLTFKEDCPDLRNSRVPDIVNELERHGCFVQLHDPLCDEDEALKEYGITICPTDRLDPASAVVLAVSHQIFREWTQEQWQKLLLPNGIVADVKNVAPYAKLKKAGHRVWKL